MRSESYYYLVQWVVVGICGLGFMIMAHAEISPIPLPLTKPQDLLMSQGTCQKDWADMATTVGVVTSDLGEGVKLWLVPCANWAYNMDWTAYITIDEPTHPDGYLTKSILFVDYSPYQGLFANPLVHNVHWDPATRSISTRYFMNGHENCGTLAKYDWNSQQQNFQLKNLIKNDDCKSPSATWVTIPLPGPSGPNAVATNVK